MNKTEAAKLLETDYIPRGPKVKRADLTFRRTEEHEVLQCCEGTGYDIQSGPFYCGKIAEWVSEVIIEGQHGVVALCERHRPPKNQRVPDPLYPDYQI